MTIDVIEKVKDQLDQQSYSVEDNISTEIETIASSMEASGDAIHSAKLREILAKFKQKRLIITFSGHFSAGKSTLINELVGHPLLPSSPIPTSANVVTIQSGEPRVRLQMTSGKQVELEYKGDLDEVRSFCINGVEVESIQLNFPLPWSPSFSFMDTPGIDSTDDAHKLSTESALHLADIIIYTMDYNHVQSELNFHFIKSLQDQGKSMVLVVNQIDKHQAAELPFEAYQQSVKTAFAAWQISPLALFFTTLKRKDHPFNQLDSLKALLHSWMEDRDSILSKSLVRTSLQLIEDHAAWLRSQQEGERSAFDEKLDQLSSREHVEEEAVKLSHSIQSITERPLRLETDGKKEIETIIQNANLTPFAIRELAERFLESQKPSFKVGLFFSAKKTNEEKEARLRALHTEFTKQAHAHLEWHLKELLIRLMEQDGSATPAYLEEVHHMQVVIEPQFLMDHIHPGALASLSGLYVLQFSQDIAQAMKSSYRRKALELLERGKMLSQAKAEADLLPLQQKLREMSEALEAIRGLVDLDNELMSKSTLYVQSLLQNVRQESGRDRSASSSAVGFTDSTHQNSDITTYKGNKYVIDWDSGKGLDQGDPQQPEIIHGPYKAKLQQTAKLLRQTADVTKSIAGVSAAFQGLTERANRLEKNLFTIALFGAFSAGKSSFANALMGNRVLPVSPNPTTAAINKVLPPDDDHPHGTVRVKLKSESDLMKDLSHSLKVFGQDATSIVQAINQVKVLKAEDWNPSAKPHYSFLKAAEQGYAALGSQLGEELIVDAEQYQSFVTDEQKAAFVEWIELYYHCPLTAQGIALVDTPGADSINARHTGVAFEYIKNADAVLFVTYYNHAFSHADKDFLTQLGRVKETFEMDKMFFIVNAADLAKDEEELQSVVTHVRDNLTTHGIREARIYPISSQKALISEELAHSGLPEFEKDFITFTVEELTQVAVASAAYEVERLRKQIAQLLFSFQQDESERIRQKEAAIITRVTALQQHVDYASNLKLIEKESSELLFYVKKRILDRFNEYFQLAFNPASIKEDGRNMKQVLRGCLDELLQSISYELSQEARATTLRMERYLRKSQERSYAKWCESLSNTIKSSSFEPSPHTPCPVVTPDFPLEMEIEDIGPFTKALSLYKNARHFFELDGRIAMREALEKQFLPVVNNHITQLESLFNSFYTQTFEDQMSEMKSEILLQVDSYYEGIIGMLSNEIDVHALDLIEKQLDSFVTKMKSM